MFAKTSFSKALILSAVLVTATIPSRKAEATTVKDVIAALKAAYSAYEMFADGGLTLEEATDQMLDAIESAKDEILSHMDGLVAAEAEACANGVITAFGYIEALSYDNRQALAIDAVACLALIEGYLEAVDDEAAVDKLGFALNALGPIAMLARAYAELPETFAISDMVINGNYTVIAKLHPSCITSTLWGDSDGGFVERTIRCTAYNDDLGFAMSWIGDPDYEDKVTIAEDKATSNTSRAIAQQLQSEIPQPPEPPPLLIRRGAGGAMEEAPVN